MSDYKDLVVKASVAVQGIEDMGLRMVAFEKILENLITREKSFTMKRSPQHRKQGKYREVFRS